MKARAQGANHLKQGIASFWNDRNPRERNILVIGGLALLLILYYLLFIDPAYSGRKDLEKKLPSLRQQTAEVQALSREAQQLGSRTQPPPPLLTKESIDTALNSRGLKAQNVLVTGEVVKVQFTAASFSGITDWLADAQKTARLSVVDANVEAQEKPDTVNATVTLRQTRSGQ
jgi:general secretion pathway protein M